VNDAAELWAPRRRPFLLGANLAGAALVAAAWWGSSLALTVGHQVVWANVGFAGLAVACLGDAWWLATGRRAVDRRQRDALETVRRARPLLSSRVLAADLVAVPEATRYHRPSCALVDGKAVREGARAGHESSGLQPCGVCRP
jgi:hypothetical protein